MEQKFILVVDDDESITSSLRSLLESDAVAVRTASTMDEAEALLGVEAFDLAIVDLRLTGTVGTDGFDLVSKIHQQMPETQVVLFTAHGSPEIEQEARRRGAVDYWEKTISIPGLIGKLKALGIPMGYEGNES